MPQPNRIKEAIREERKAHGFCLTLPSASVVEILGKLDFDFVFIDGEHGCFGLALLEEVCRTAELVGITPIARVPDISEGTIGRYLDRGVRGIIGPHISTREDAEMLVRASYFGPIGERSCGSSRGNNYGIGIDDWSAHMTQSNETIIVGAMIEDQAGVDNLDDIMAVPHIDYLMIGPQDFAQGAGYPGQPRHPEVRKRMDAVHDRVRAAGHQVREDILNFAWDRELLMAGAQGVLDSWSAAAC
jgi:2-keto-3-deoxy-L-rhamnonate aldolase RhmA